MEREVGGGIGMGNTCKPMAVSFQCMTKFTTNKKKNNSPPSAGDARNTGSISGSGSSPGEGKATHTSILAWDIPLTEEPGGLQSIGSESNPAE